MSRIRQEDIDAVKERTDIVALVSQYLTLKKSGHDAMSGLCPFHQEKTASFSVSPSKGVFYCFGCGEGGDSITFLRKLENLSYVEAVERLAKDLGPDVLIEAGLATKGQDGVVRDRFRNRLTFPIQDLQGRFLGFGARILPGDARAGEQAKYLNTAETPIYKKGEVLYNLHRARQPVARAGDVFVVEGYTDVIGLAQAGIENAVATCGTALGEKHFALLSRFAQRAVLAFDSDDAGARAAERAFAFQER